MINFSFGAASILKLPSISVIVPRVRSPSTRTLAPITASPVPSTTVPVTVRSCADTWGSGNPVDYVNNPDFYNFRPGDDFRTVASFGWKLNEKTGVLTTPADYEGWGVRIAFAVGFEYAYGVKSLCGKGAPQILLGKITQYQLTTTIIVDQ